MTFEVSDLAVRPSPDWSDRKLEIWADLRNIFLHEGFQEFTVGDLAERLHCSRRTLYGFATSRDELILGVVQDVFTESLSAASSAAESGERIQAVSAYLAAGLVAVDASPAFFDDVFERPSTQRAFQGYREAGHRLLVALLDEGMAGGWIRRCDSEAAAGILEAAADSLLQRRLRLVDFGVAEAKDLLADLVEGWLSSA